jgi:hypothetical protein
MIDAANAMIARNIVQPVDQSHAIETFAIESDGNAIFEFNFHDCALLGASSDFSSTAKRRQAARPTDLPKYRLPRCVPTN